ncbi:hypothetical protein [Salibaculum griseiflavum]|uniref:hypothetical protein n=1 Tax=Salibaculum griseiflavum TaxID=1914409 RepID=UPI001C38788C|nr:hypothetical protein [Salibaculum griseiflavum]
MRLSLIAQLVRIGAISRPFLKPGRFTEFSPRKIALSLAGPEKRGHKCITDA